MKHLINQLRITSSSGVGSFYNHIKSLHPLRGLGGLVVGLLLLSAGSAMANNIQVSNISVAQRNSTAKYVIVQFDLSWSNSFRNAENWDAAWVFLKYRKSGDANLGYFHGTVGASASHVMPTGFTFTQPTDNKGLFVYRSAAGTGDVSLTGVKVRWDYGTDGLDSVNVVDFQVLAMEMVYVPQGAFYVGSGGVESGSLTDGSWSSGNSIPYQVTSENAILVGSGTGKLFCTNNSGNMAIATGTLPAAFPKGYSAFYCMKYEITQKGYVDFLNTLTRTQQGNRVDYVSANCFVRTNNTSISYRNAIRCPATIPAAPSPVTFFCDFNNNGTGNEDADGLNIACNFLNYSDLWAYLDWAGLRPMSELEYEKAARGAAYPTIDDYAWGASNPVAATGLAASGWVDERASNAGANMVHNIYNVPFRVGFASNDTTTRYQSGASYWGIMELSGNVYERAVSIYLPNFTSALGDGALNGNGDADAAFISYWLGRRGGSCANAIQQCRISDRAEASYNDNTRYYYYGGRGVRQAP
ncbi:MAG TPA: SUMF1/EgtB/PvdO family nonheme iron enzyme [Paludibacter sp.]|nr:SUMF1/EgtB/PvdO family nonheme iron enzyme [Paludibacter sp.]